MSRKELLEKFWAELINPVMQEHWIDNLLRNAQKHPDEPFAECGAALGRLLALGASRRDLSLLQRMATYEAVFSTLYMLDELGIRKNDLSTLYESLLTADPSGLDGRPGSAPEKD